MERSETVKIKLTVVEMLEKLGFGLGPVNKLEKMTIKHHASAARPNESPTITILDAQGTLEISWEK